MEESKRNSGRKMDEYVRSLADFAQRRLGTDLGLRALDGETDPQLGLSGSDSDVERETYESDEEESSNRGSGGGWGPPQPGLVQEQVEAAIGMLAVIHAVGLAFERSNRGKTFGQSDPFNTFQTREAISVHMTPHLTHLTRLSAAEGLGHNLMAGLRAGIREVPRLIQATRKHSDSFRTVCHGSPTLDSFQFKKTREAGESNEDSKEANKVNEDSKEAKEVKQEESTNNSKDSKECGKKTAEAVFECRLNSSLNQICPANQVSPLADVAHLFLTSCPSDLTPHTWQAAISTYYTKLASTVAQFGLLLKHLGVSQQALQAEAGRVLAGQWLVVALVIPAVNNCSRIDRGLARALLCAAKRMDLQVYWPARRLSAPNLGLVRMNSVSEEQEDEDEELKATKKSAFEEGEAREVVARYTQDGVPTIQAVRDGKATKKDFAGPLPLAVG